MGELCLANAHAHPAPKPVVVWLLLPSTRALPSAKWVQMFPLLAAPPPPAAAPGPNPSLGGVSAGEGTSEERWRSGLAPAHQAHTGAALRPHLHSPSPCAPRTGAHSPGIASFTKSKGRHILFLPQGYFQHLPDMGRPQFVGKWSEKEKFILT